MPKAQLSHLETAFCEDVLENSSCRCYTILFCPPILSAAQTSRDKSCCLSAVCRAESRLFSGGGLFSVEMPEIAAFQHTLPVLACLPCRFLGSGKGFCVSHCQSSVILHRLLFRLFMCCIYISHLWIKANLFWPLFLYSCNLQQALQCVFPCDLRNTEISIFRLISRCS